MIIIWYEMKQIFNKAGSIGYDSLPSQNKNNHTRDKIIIHLIFVKPVQAYSAFTIRRKSI